VSPGLARIRQAAENRKEERFTTLLHHIDAALLEQAYYGLKREAAPGVDGVTWARYGDDLAGRLADLHERVHRGSYRAQPSRRTYIPKPDGRQRPLGIAALEDKIVQRAMVELLNAIYEEDFLGFRVLQRQRKGVRDELKTLSYSCVKDEGRPLGIGFQERVPNHPRLLWSRAMVASAGGKARAKTRAGEHPRDERE
jgi:hypothetical protein